MQGKHNKQKYLHNGLAIVFSVLAFAVSYQLAAFYRSGQSLVSTIEDPVSKVSWQQGSRQNFAWQTAVSSTGRGSNTAAKSADNLISELSKNRNSQQPRVLGATTASASSENNISSDFANNIILPSVAQVLVHYDGGFTIPDFDIDLKTFAMTPRTDLPLHSVSEKDQYVYGTGFAVNPDGYFVTNSHVISKHELEADVYADVKNHFKDVYQYEYDALNKQQYTALNNYYDSFYGSTNDPAAEQKFAKDITDQIKKYIKTNLKDDITQTIAVLNPSTRNSSLDQGKELQEMMQKGLAATIVSYNDNYEDDQKDVAILKIDQKDLPSLTLSSDDNLQVGKPVTVFGFPANADIDSSDFQPSETQGIVSSIKDLQGMKLYQLDAKISEGSSGSPVVNSKGEVVGIMTLLSTGPGYGDNFGYALPISVIKDAMQASSVQNSPGSYDTALLAGISFKDQQLCRKANAQFQIAKAANDKFIPTDRVNSYINACQALIASGKSLDSTKDIIVNYVKTQKVVSISILAVLAALLAVGGFFLLRLLRRHSETPGMDTTPMPPVAPPSTNLVA